jgi:hypothetical protein
MQLSVRALLVPEGCEHHSNAGWAVEGAGAKGFKAGKYVDFKPQLARKSLLLPPPTSPPPSPPFAGWPRFPMASSSTGAAAPMSSSALPLTSPVKSKRDSASPLIPQPWVPDATVSACRTCTQEFTMLRRCVCRPEDAGGSGRRAAGASVCGRLSPERLCAQSARAEMRMPSRRRTSLRARPRLRGRRPRCGRIHDRPRLAAQAAWPHVPPAASHEAPHFSTSPSPYIRPPPLPLPPPSTGSTTAAAAARSSATTAWLP